MFARIVEFTPKLEKKEELVKVIRSEVLPILKKQTGFMEILPFSPRPRMKRWLSSASGWSKEMRSAMSAKCFQRSRRSWSRISPPRLRSSRTRSRPPCVSTSCKRWAPKRSRPAHRAKPEQNASAPVSLCSQEAAHGRRETFSSISSPPFPSMAAGI
jgi:hypothetical protein